MPFRIGVSGLLFAAFTLSGCVENKPTPDASIEDVDASVPEDTTVFIELRYTASGPNGDGGFVTPARIARYTSIKLFVGGDAGHVIEGVSDGGRIVFENVPGANNVIELRSPHATIDGGTFVLRSEVHRRDIYFAYQQLARTDVAVAEAGNDLRFDVTGLTPWNPDEDTLFAYSSLAQFARGWAPDPGAAVTLDRDATSVSGLEVNTLDMSADDYRSVPAVVDASKGDALKLVQRRTAWVTSFDAGVLERWDPWAGSYATSSIASANVTMPNFSGAAPLVAAFSPLTPTPLTLDVRADTFAAAVAELDFPADVRMSSSNSISFEGGSGDALYLTPTTAIWSYTSRGSQRIPVDVACYPDFDNVCDAGCTACNSALTTQYRHPGNVMLPTHATHPFDEPGTEMLASDWRIWTPLAIPDAGSLSLSAWNYNAVPVPNAATVVVQRELSAPRQLRVDGAPLTVSANIAALANRTPVISWSAPSLGTPDFYRVQVLEYFLGNTPITSQVVAAVRGTKRSEQLPEGVLQPGHTYLLRVIAVVDPNDVDDARATSRSGAYRRAEALTGLFTVQ